MNSAELIVEVEERVCWLLINRPEKMNSITMEVLARIEEELVRFEQDPHVKAVAISGVGGKAFCTGVGLSTMAAGASYFDLHQARARLGSLFQKMWRYPKPIFAVVDGYALAGGFGLAAACDFVVASEDSAFGVPEINVGVWPFIITVPLLRYVHPRVLLELMMTGRRIGAEEALRIGVVNWVYPKSELRERAAERIAEIASKSGSILALGKASFYRALDMDSSSALAYLQSMLTVVTGLEDSREGLTAFIEKRPPEWKDR